MEAQRVMAGSQYDVAGSQCDMACSFYLLLGRFGSFGLVPRRVGGPMRHGALVLPSFCGIWTLGTRATSCWRPNASWRAPNATWRTRLPSFWGDSDPWARATSCWRPNTTWRAPNTTWRARFALFRGDSDAWISSHVALEAQHDMAGSQYDVAGRNTMRRAFF